MKLKDIQVHGKTEWLNAIYTDATGEEFEVVFTRSVDENSSHELRELTTVEQAEKTLSCEHPIWNEIEKLVVEAEWEETIDYRNVHFVIKINRNWLDVLQELTCGPLPRQSSQLSALVDPRVSLAPGVSSLTLGDGPALPAGSRL